MRNFGIVLYFLCIHLGCLYSQEYLPIKNVISSGDTNTSEICYDGEAICVGNDQGVIRRLDPETGDVIEVLENKLITTCGLGFDGSYYLAQSKNKDKIYYLNTADLAVVDSIVPDPFSGYLHGIAWDGTYVWYTIFHFGKTDTIYRYDPISAETTSSPFMDEYSKGVAYDGLHLWISDNTNQSNPLIYKIDQNTLQEVAVYKAPGGKYPNGLTFDGDYLWLSNNETDSIYQLDIGLATDAAELEPTDEIMQVFPNPCIDQLNIQCSNGLIGRTIEIFDLSGVLVDKVKITSTQELLDASRYKPGTYLLYVDARLQELVLMVD